MRLLTSCPACRRQFDATGQEIGDRFHCYCGAIVAVQAPKSAELEVLRCSGCGGTREQGKPACSFCGSDFSPKDLALDTVCPGCFARTFDRVRFCHRCGIAIAPSESAGELVEKLCPACQPGQKLISRRLGPDQPTILECRRCVGFWLEAEAFRLLVSKSKRKALDDLADPSRGALRAPAAPSQTGRMYRDCLTCGKTMNRQNYGRRSGIVIDVCRDHGVWFDADELEQLLRWVEAGGLAKSEAAEHEQRKIDLAREKMKSTGAPAPIFTDLSPRPSRALGNVLIDLAFEVLKQW